MLVTPKQARQWLDHNQYKYQRPIAKSKLKNYVDMMAKGKWEPATQIKFGIGPCSPEPILIDGQHRLLAQVNSNTIQEYDVTTVTYRDEPHLARLYGTTDRGIPRTTFWALKSTGLQDLLGLFDWQMYATIGGVKLISGKFVQGYSPFTGPSMDDLLAEEILKYSDGIDSYFEMTSYKKHLFKIVRRSSTCALGIVTFQYACATYGRKKVEEFWDGTIYGNNIKDGDPRKVAHEHLIYTELRGKNPNNRREGSTSTEYQVRWLINCWNAFTEGRVLTTSRVLNPTDKVHINGTPWK